jgi:hypothetical protein
LNSLGLEDFAFEKLSGLPQKDHDAPWYWEAARIMCFDQPALSSAHRNALVGEAESLRTDATEEFRAYGRYDTAHDSDGASLILERIPPRQLGNYGAELLLKIGLEQNWPAVLDLARRTDCWDLRNGRHWQYLAEAEERWGSLDAARAAWRRAVFYYPDDEALMKAAADFAAKHDDAALKQQIADSARVYGAP